MEQETVSQSEIRAIEFGGRVVKLNVYGKMDLLLGTLYQVGLLPDLIIHAVADSDEYYIGSTPVGKTESEISTNIWLMVERFKNTGSVFE